VPGEEPTDLGARHREVGTEHALRFGLARQPRVANTLGSKVKSFLGVIHVLPFDRQDAIASAAIQARLEKLGSPIGPYDVLIAGVALARDLTMVTSNEREFVRVSDLVLENCRTSA
jgi:tRNA(fMet)-specific endonuclease VapC